MYPLVPGYVQLLRYNKYNQSTRLKHFDKSIIFPNLIRHEIVGIVKEVGSNVENFKIGDHVGVGTYVDSCRDCDLCNQYIESHCSKAVLTFNGVGMDGTVTQGGYSSHIVVHNRYKCIIL